MLRLCPRDIAESMLDCAPVSDMYLFSILNNSFAVNVCSPAVARLRLERVSA